MNKILAAQLTLQFAFDAADTEHSASLVLRHCTFPESTPYHAELLDLHYVGTTYHADIPGTFLHGNGSL